MAFGIANNANKLLTNATTTCAEKSWRLSEDILQKRYDVLGTVGSAHAHLGSTEGMCKKPFPNTEGLFT